MKKKETILEELPSRHTFLKSLGNLWISLHPEYTKNLIFDKKCEYAKFLSIPIPGASTMQQVLRSTPSQVAIQNLKYALVTTIAPYTYHKLLCRIPEPLDTSIRIAWYYGPEPIATQRLGSQHSTGWRFNETLGIYVLDDIRTVPRTVQDAPRTNEIFLPTPAPKPTQTHELSTQAPA